MQASGPGRQPSGPAGLDPRRGRVTQLTEGGTVPPPPLRGEARLVTYLAGVSGVQTVAP